ncbi:aminomethyltransferase domain protein [Burkholderia mallei]|nr:aminomethyltransferase domain protein [Burkholderia mallei]
MRATRRTGRLPTEGARASRIETVAQSLRYRGQRGMHASQAASCAGGSPSCRFVFAPGLKARPPCLGPR